MAAALLLLVSPVAAGAGAAENRVECAGVEVRLSAAAARQGSLVLVEVEAGMPLTELYAEWRGAPLRFWGEENPGRTRRALLAIDLEQKPGWFPLVVRARLRNGTRLGCSALVRVEEGEFAVERLQVERRFVELSSADRERAEQEAERLRQVFARVTPERLWRGGFRVPVRGAEAAGNFGRRRILNEEPGSPHTGEDFPAKAGTPVRAAERGRVVLAEGLFFSGRTVVLDHGLGLYTFYGHLAAIAVKEGEVVEAGTALGRVGATGRVTGAHLHWAARLNQTRVNPLELVALLGE
ncbi:MAG: M23 family metallopeptidase [Acidobacteria bacterium]|nr:M23 family metallopeptidase [Acidobacteriota bacterium]